MVVWVASGALEATKSSISRCAEAAFQALKFWQVREEFIPLGGEAAYQLSAWLNEGCSMFEWDLGRHLATRMPVDRSYGGFGSNWWAMEAVLNAKFAGRLGVLLLSASVLGRPHLAVYSV